MDLVCSIPEVAYPKLHQAFVHASGEHGTLSERKFLSVVRPFINPPQAPQPADDRKKKKQPSAPRPSSPVSRRLSQVFQRIDFRDSKKISWEEFSMHLIDAVSRGGTAGGDSSTATARLDSYELGSVKQQNPPGRVRLLKYVPQWDRTIRVTSFNGLHGIELSNATTQQVYMSAPSQRTAIVNVEAIPRSNVVAVANADITASFFRVTQQNNVFSRPALNHERTASQKEIDTSVMVFRYHNKADILFSGMQSGAVTPWALNLERASVHERYKYLANDTMQVHSMPVTVMMPHGDTKLLTGSLDRTISVVDLENWRVEEVLHGHTQGVLGLAWSDFSGLAISGGFESGLFAWNLSMRDKMKPWRLLDRSNPHRGDVNFLHCPAGSPQVISSDTRGIVKVWDMRNFQCVQTLQPDRFFAAADLAGASVTKTLLVPMAHRSKGGGGSTGGGKGGGGAGGKGGEQRSAADDPLALLNKEQHHPFTATFNTASKVVMLTGSRATYNLASDQPQNLATADDFPVTVAVCNPHMQCYLTAHHHSVKIWDMATGAVIHTFPEIAGSEIMAATIDNTGRKFFLGTRRGRISGHVFLSGAEYRVFRESGPAVVDLEYWKVRDNRRLLFSVHCHEVFNAFEDNDLDTKQLSITQPVHLISALLRLTIDRAEQEAQRVTQSVVPVKAARRKSRLASAFQDRTPDDEAGKQPDMYEDAQIDENVESEDDGSETTNSPTSPRHSMLVRSCVMSNADVQKLVSMSDQQQQEQAPSKEATSTDSTHETPSQPHLAKAATSVRKVDRMRANESEVTAGVPKQSRFDFTSLRVQLSLSLMYVAVRNVVAVIDMYQLITVHVFFFENDVTVVEPLGDLPAFVAIDAANVLFAYSVRPCRSAEQLICARRLNLHPPGTDRAHVAAVAAYHPSAQLLAVGDNLGYLSMWDLRPFIRNCALTPMRFPSHTLSSTVLRKKVSFPPAAESGGLLERRWGPYDAHADEVTSIEFVTNHKSAPIVLSGCWGDHRIRFFTTEGEPLGELSQGRLQRAEATDPETVELHYRRHGVRPYLVSDYSFEHEPIDVLDMPELAVFVLKKAARRFKERRQRLRDGRSFVTRRSITASDVQEIERRASISVAAPLAVSVTEEAEDAEGQPEAVPAAEAAEGEEAAPLLDVASDDTPMAHGSALKSSSGSARHKSRVAFQTQPTWSDDDDDTPRPAAFAKWTVAKNLDRATGEVKTTHVPHIDVKSKSGIARIQEGVTFDTTDTSRSIDLSTYEPQRGRRGRLHRSGRVVPGTLSHDPQYEAARGSSPVGEEVLYVDGNARSWSPSTRPELALSDTTKAAEADQARADHEQHIVETCSMRPESLRTMHHAMEAYRTRAAVSEDMGRAARKVHTESAKRSGVPKLPDLQCAVPPSATPRGPIARHHEKHARTARGPTVGRAMPLGARGAEELAARNLFADEPVEMPRLPPVAQTARSFSTAPSTRSQSSAAAYSRVSETLSTSRFNAGAYTPMYRTDPSHT